MAKVTSSDTGIYVHETVSLKGATQSETQSLVKQAFARVNAANDIEHVLDRIETDVKAILVGHIVDAKPESEQRAKAEAKLLLVRLADLRKALSNDDAKGAALSGVWVGRTYEKMLVLPHESNAARGKKTLSAAKQGHAEVHGDNAEKLARWQKYKADFDKLYKPGDKKTALYKRIADSHGVAPKTVSRAILRLSEKK